MSNLGGQGPPGANPQQVPMLLRPEHIAGYSFLDDSQKVKYSQGLKGLWDQVTNKPADSQEHKMALEKIREFTQKLRAQAQRHQAQQAAQAAQTTQVGGAQTAQQSNNNPPQAHGHPSIAQAQQPQQPQPHSGQAQQPHPPPSQPGLPRQYPPQIVQQVSTFPYVLPPNLSQGTPEAEKFLKEQKSQHLNLLVRMLEQTNFIKSLNASIEQQKKSNQEVSPDLIQKRNQAQQTYNQAQHNLQAFRQRHNTARQHQNQQHRPQPQPQQPPSQTPQQPSVGGPPIKTEPTASAPAMGASQQFQGPVSGSQGQQHQPPPQGHQVTAPTSHAAVDAARAQANVARASHSPATTAPTQFQQQQGPTAPSFSQTTQAPGQSTMAGPAGMSAQPTANRPPLNTQPASLPQHNSPHSATNTTGPPVPYSHQAALNASARTYSDQQQRGTPQITPNQGYHSRDQLNQPKMPIPKNLQVTQPTPVSMGPARPTMGGPGNGAPGIMGQPVIPKVPGYQLEGEGDRVLSKKKLDELVRQVTGGGVDIGGESLSPEVEEIFLDLADEFVDNVVTAACRIAKLRESATLEIRDIQLVLERNYNIRIPGYASDEVRTVRKFNPAPGWTQKMNAVQAAKVMGGKTDI